MIRDNDSMMHDRGGTPMNKSGKINEEQEFCVASDDELKNLSDSLIKKNHTIYEELAK